MKKEDLFVMPDPYNGNVDLHEVLNEISDFIKKHVVVTDEEIDVTTLWIAFTYLVNCFKHSPRLLISSPQMQCGKTTFIELLAALSNKPLYSSSFTPASIFRIIDEFQPTIMADEADTYIYNNEDMRNIVNQGHTKAGSKVARCKANTHEVEFFNTYSAMVIGQIGLPPSTILDRCITIHMRRKKPSEVVEVFNSEDLNIKQKLDLIRSKLLKWANDNSALINQSKVSLPDTLNNRNADKWRSLFLIANIAGNGWEKRIVSASIKIVSFSSDDEANLQIQLLKDIKNIFDARKRDKLTTAEILRELNNKDDRPWLTINKGRPLDGQKLAAFLIPYKIKPDNRTFSSGLRLKGYKLSDFQDTFDRFLQ